MSYLLFFIALSGLLVLTIWAIGRIPQSPNDAYYDEEEWEDVNDSPYVD